MRRTAAASRASCACWTRGTLEFPDYEGNAMFQTLGNLAVDPRAGLLFVDFASGATLQLSGRAQIVWEPERAVRFAVERWVERPARAPA